MLSIDLTSAELDYLIEDLYEFGHADEDELDEYHNYYNDYEDDDWED